jgi:hypothetical protein
MRSAAGILPALLLLASPAYAQRSLPDRPQRAAVAAPATLTDRLIQQVYFTQFQLQVGVTGEPLDNIKKLLTQWLNQRRNVTAKRNDALTALRQLLADGNASEEELVKRIAEIDQFDNQARNRDRQLLMLVDPQLTPAQRAKFRIFLVDIEQQLHEMVDSARKK